METPAPAGGAAPDPGRGRRPAPGLRQTILDTARRLLDAGGVAGLSLREVARQAGVTHQAPYHHFGDRESILAELVVQGFEQLARALAQANARAAHDGIEAAVLASGEAYIGFALSHPGVFRIMFRPECCDPARFPQVQEAGARARAELDRLVRQVHGEDASEALASMYWAHVHGLSCLLLDGPLGAALADPVLRRAHLAAVGACFTRHLLPAPVA